MTPDPINTPEDIERERILSKWHREQQPWDFCDRCGLYISKYRNLCDRCDE